MGGERARIDEVTSGGAYRQIVGRLVVLAAVIAATFAMMATAASAAGTLTVAISGAGAVGGGGIDCSRTVDRDAERRRARGDHRRAECDLTRKPPCITVPGTAVVTARAASGFAFDRWTGACAGSTRATCIAEMPRSAVRLPPYFRDATNPTVVA